MAIAVTIAPFRVNSQEEMGLIRTPGDAQYDHVGAGSDGGEIAAEVCAESQRPPQ
jgi:hypothetical protein